jgi:hypothetical protein
MNYCEYDESLGCQGGHNCGLTHHVSLFLRKFSSLPPAAATAASGSRRHEEIAFEVSMTLFQDYMGEFLRLCSVCSESGGDLRQCTACESVGHELCSVFDFSGGLCDECVSVNGDYRCEAGDDCEFPSNIDLVLCYSCNFQYHADCDVRSMSDNMCVACFDADQELLEEDEDEARSLNEFIVSDSVYVGDDQHDDESSSELLLE